MADYSFKGKIPNTNYYGGKNNFSQNTGVNNEKENFVKELKFNDKDEITDEKGTNYVDIAKKIIEGILVPKKENGNTKYVCGMSTNQIRNILSFLSVIFQKVQNNNNFDSILSDMYLLKIKLLYTEGRYKDDKNKKHCSFFIKNANLVELISKIDKKEKLINYYHYMEALVAWHKYYGGEE